MNYDRVIVELLDRISKLEEKTDRLERALAERNVASVPSNPEAPKTRDKTKYMFDGHICLKNRLVLEIVKKYVVEHPQISFGELRSVFYDRLQGSFGVIREKSMINSQNQTRYFFKEADTITLHDETQVVVSNQWGKDNIKPFIVLAKSLGYEIEEV